MLGKQSNYHTDVIYNLFVGLGIPIFLSPQVLVLVELQTLSTPVQGDT